MLAIFFLICVFTLSLVSNCTLVFSKICLQAKDEKFLDNLEQSTYIAITSELATDVQLKLIQTDKTLHIEFFKEKSALIFLQRASNEVDIIEKTKIVRNVGAGDRVAIVHPLPKDLDLWVKNFISIPQSYDSFEINFQQTMNRNGENMIVIATICSSQDSLDFPGIIIEGLAVPEPRKLKGGSLLNFKFESKIKFDESKKDTLQTPRDLKIEQKVLTRTPHLQSSISTNRMDSIYAEANHSPQQITAVESTKPQNSANLSLTMSGGLKSQSFDNCTLY